MAAHELDLRPKNARMSSPSNRHSTAEASTPPLLTKRPTLDDILADRSAPPWTFRAFDRYCTHNLCSENLHFVLDAALYTKVYTEWREEFPEDDDASALDPRMAQLNGIWRRLIRDYITRNSPKEVNLPASVRDVLANLPETDIPPDAKVLRPSVGKVRELIEESILLSFLNDKLPQTQSDENLHLRASAPPERPNAMDLRTRSSAAHLPSIGAPTAISIQAASSGHGGKSSSGNNIYHKRAVSTSTAPPPSSSIYAGLNSSSGNDERPRSLFSVKEKGGSAAASVLDRERDSDVAVATPPGTPMQQSQRRLSPWSSKDAGANKELSTWKKLGSKLGLKKKGSGSLRKDEPVFEEDE